MRAEIFTEHPDNWIYLHRFCLAVPRVVWRNVRIVITHYSLALWGVGLQLEGSFHLPATGRVWAILAAWAALAGVAITTGHPAILAGLIGFFVSPLWTYCCASLNDPVFEYRAYLSVAGWAILIASAPAWFHAPLIVIWILQSFRRSFYFRSNVHFWKQAEKENPVIHPNRAHNPGVCYWDAGLHDDAIASFNRLLRLYPDNRKLTQHRQGCAVDKMRIHSMKHSGKVYVPVIR